MLKRRFRALSAEKVTELFEGEHETESSRFFRLIWDRPSSEQTQVVVVLPRKLGLNAVQRNQLRRQVFSVVKPFFSDWTAGVRLAILVKNAALLRTRRQFQDDLVSLLKKAALQ